MPAVVKDVTGVSMVSGLPRHGWDVYLAWPRGERGGQPLADVQIL
jgi:hypothetical protein